MKVLRPLAFASLLAAPAAAQAQTSKDGQAAPSSAPAGEEGARARQAGAGSNSCRHAVAHGERGMQRLGFVRVVVDQLPEPGRLRRGDAQRMVQPRCIEPHRHAGRGGRAHGARRGGGMEQARMARAERLAQAQRDFVAGHDGRCGALVREPERGCQCEHRRDGDHARMQHGRAVRVVDLAKMRDAVIGGALPPILAFEPPAAAAT